MPADPQVTKVEPQSEADAKMVDLPSEGPEVEVKFDETKKTINPDEVESVDVGVTETASSTEMDDYGKKVQSRIDKLTKRLRESERREQAAIQYAQGVQADSSQVRQRAAQVNSGYMAEFGDRVTSQIAEAKKEMKEAMDLGDTDKQVEAQTKLSRLAKEMQARGVDPRRPQMPQYQQPPRPQAPPPPDPKAEDWAEKNEWFGEDEPMTLTSFSIHRKLMEEGFDPASDTYYSEVDKRMRDTFPHKFESSTPTQSVASANRGGPIRRKGTVRLTPSQVAISKKLGVPLSEYAKYVKE
jgi:hypothetical protein